MRIKNFKRAVALFRVDVSTRKLLFYALSLCMALCLLTVKAMAAEHDHAGGEWKTIRRNTDSNYTIGAVGGGSTVCSYDSIPEGKYYIPDGGYIGSLTLKNGTYVLCLNGRSSSKDNAGRIQVEAGASLTICDCSEGETGRICTTISEGSRPYVILLEGGTFILESGTIEAAGNGMVVNANKGSTFTMTGGKLICSSKEKSAVSMEGTNISSKKDSVFHFSGGTISGGKYGIEAWDYSKVYLSSSPVIENSEIGNIFVNDTQTLYAAENGTPYSGSQLTMRPRSFYHEYIIVNAAEDLSKFALPSKEKYPEGQYIELVHNSEKNAILTKGLPVPVEWYDENERRLTGSGYPDTLTAGTVITKDTEDFPVGPAVAGKAFLNDWDYRDWNYAKNQFFDWSGHGVKKNNTHITGPMYFKPMYADAYTVTFHANGGEGAMDKQQFIRGGSAEPLTTNAFTNGEMAFIGWNTAPDGSGTAYDATKYLKFDDFAADITLYAQWMPAHRHDISTDCGVSDASVDFTIWASSTSLPTSSGRYVLANDVTLGKWNLRYDTSMEIVLCLNGRSVTLTGTSTGIDVGYQDHITICDCAEAPGKITRPSDSAYALADLSGYNAKLTILGGVFSWCADQKLIGQSARDAVSIQGGIFSGSPDPDNKGYIPSGKNARPIAPSDPGYQDGYAGYYTIASGPAAPTHTHAVSTSCSTSGGKQETFLPLDRYSRAGAGSYYLTENIL